MNNVLYSKKRFMNILQNKNESLRKIVLLLHLTNFSSNANPSLVLLQCILGGLVGHRMTKVPAFQLADYPLHVARCGVAIHAGFLGGMHHTRN